MYLVDPKTNKKSVSLTFLVITFLLYTGFSVGKALEYVNQIGSLAELFYACAALYFGRRVKVGTKAFEMSQEGSKKNESN